MRVGRVLVGISNGGLAVIDAERNTTYTVSLASHPEAFELDPGTARAYVNTPASQATST